MAAVTAGLIVAVVVTASAAAAGPQAAENAAVPADAYGDVDRSYEVGFRQANGLRSDDEAVRTARASERDGNIGLATYGVPLTPDELRQLQAGERAADQAEAVQRSVQERYPQGWAGMWVDRSRAGEAVFQYSPAVPAGAEDYVRARGVSARLECAPGYDCRVR